MRCLANLRIVDAMPWTYIVECADGSYYVGSTWNLEHRLWQHNESDTEGAAYTRSRRPVTLAWSGWFDRVDEAFALEKQVQGWSRRKREALIADNWAALPALAARPKARGRRLAALEEEPPAGG